MVSNISIMLDELKEEGIKEGIKEGIEKGIYIMIENMLKLGVDINLISKSSEVSVEEILKIKSEM